MWKLSRKTPSSTNDNEVRLLVGKEYIVGRKECPITIKDDPSISRKHAALTVQHDIANLGDVSKVPELTITDSSKYGTFVNGVKITQPTKLNNGDEVYFGTHNSIFRISYSPLVVVTSCLENSKKKLLKKQIHLLGGHLVNEWKTGQVTHLVMDGLVFTIKVIHALAECCSIVTPSLFDETIKTVESKQTLPTPKMFLPPLKEESIKSDEPLFLPDQKRKTLFAEKTFFFLSEKQFKRTHEAIEMCSGKTVLLEVSSDLQKDGRLVKKGCCLMMMDQKERDSLNMDGKEWITQLMDFLRSNKKRPIPESELGLAILQMTLQNYCNPNIDAVPAITQNIVCQSLNVGLDEMSQVYSPQHKEQPTQFKRPSTSTNGKEQQHNTASQSDRKNTVKTKQSTITSAFTPKRSQVTKSVNEERKASATETPEHAMKSDKPKEVLPVTPIPDTMNISDEGNVFVADTPARKSSTSTTSSSFTNNNKNSKNIVVPDSLGFENLPSKSDAVKTNFKNTKNGKELDDDIFSLDQTSRSNADVTIVQNTRKGKVCVSDSEGFDIDELESKSTSKDGTEGAVGSRRSAKQTEIVPESMRRSVGENEFEPETPSKSTHKYQLSSQTSTSRTNREDKPVIPDSLGLDTETNRKDKPVIPDSLGLDSETNDFNSIQTIKRNKLASELHAIPDSMDFDDGVQETTNKNILPTTLSMTSKHTDNYDSKRFMETNDSYHESTNGSQTNSTRLASKRRRLTEDENDSELEHKKLPVKRIKNEEVVVNESELNVESDGSQRRQSRKEKNIENVESGRSNGCTTQEDVSTKSSVLPLQRKTLPDGFLSARIPGESNHQEAQKPVKPAKSVYGDEEADFNEDDLPRNLVVVEVVSLVVRKPRGKNATNVQKAEKVGKNFKKFTKHWYAGCDRRFPKIIGGSDLVVHQSLSNMEHEDWFMEAREANQEQERRDRMETELFMSDVGLPQRRRKR